MFKKILVPLGDSKHTAQTLTNACELAKFFGSEIHCVFVADEERISNAFLSSFQMADMMQVAPPVFETRVIEEAREEVKREEQIALLLHRQWKEKYPDVNIVFNQTEGVVWEEILNFEKDMDLIVMGKSVYNEWDEQGNPGYNFKHVIHRSRLPVIACTKDYQIGTNLMACYDGKKPSLKALSLAIEVAKRFNVPLNILTCGIPEKKVQEINNEAVSIADNSDVKEIVSLVRPFNTVGAILGEIDTLHIDFLFLGAYGDSPLKDLILGSTTDEVLKKTGCPTLLYR